MYSQPSPFNYSLGSCITNIDEVYIFRQKKLKFMWWRLVIDYPHESFDNYRSQAVAFKMSSNGLAYRWTTPYFNAS